MVLVVVVVVVVEVVEVVRYFDRYQTLPDNESRNRSYFIYSKASKPASNILCRKYVVAYRYRY